jgi:hypothetical protein
MVIRSFRLPRAVCPALGFQDIRPRERIPEAVLGLQKWGLKVPEGAQGALGL